MIWGAPIWLNELIIYIIKLGINLLFYYISIVFIYLVYKCIIDITKQIKSSGKKFTIKFNKSNIFLIFSILISIILLVVFYYPQHVIPDKFSLNSITIRAANKPERISISSEEKLNELKIILNEYECKRSLNRGITYEQQEAVEIDIIVSDSNGRGEPMHIVITDKQHMRYSAGNTDFIYAINDSDNTLKSRMINFINSL